MDHMLRVAAPLILLGLACLAWFEPWLPGQTWIGETFGKTGVLRFVVGMLAVYTALLHVERARLESSFMKVMADLRDFRDHVRQNMGGGGSGVLAAGAAREASATTTAYVEQKTDDAIAILVGALESSDAEIRGTAAENLQRLTGQAFGEDIDAWKRWMADRKGRAQG